MPRKDLKVIKHKLKLTTTMNSDTQDEINQINNINTNKFFQGTFAQNYVIEKINKKIVI